jgi:transposase
MNSSIQIVFKEYTLRDFNQEFPDEETCLEWIKNYRYPKGIQCVKCQKITKHHKLAGRPCYKCDNCGHEVYPTAGTIFHKSATPLKIWFEAIFWLATTRSGHTAKQLQRNTGVSYKTAWRMLKLLNTLFDNGAIPVDMSLDFHDVDIVDIKRGSFKAFG